MYFLALSHPPPELDIDIANYTPDIKAPGNNPATALGPRNTPRTKGVNMTSAPGAIIFLSEAMVEILTQAL